MAFEFDAATARPDGEFDPSTATPVKPRGAIRALADLGLGVASGVTGVSGVVADAAGADNATSRMIGKANEAVQSGLSDDAKASQRRISTIMDEAKGKGTWEGVKAGGRAFAEAPGQFAAQAAGSALPFVAATLAGPVAGPLLAGGLGVAAGAGTAKRSAFDNVKQRSMDAGMSDADATAAATRAQEYGGENTDQIALGGVLGAADALTGVSRLGGGALRRALGKPAAVGQAGSQHGAIRRTAMGVAEEAPLEALQGGQEQLAGNIASQRAGFNVDTMEGVASNATLEALASAGPGAALGLVNKAPAAQTAPSTAFDPSTAVPEAEIPVSAPTQSQAMGIDPNAGPISAAAAIAVDGGAAEVVQRQQAEQAAVEAAKKVKKPGASPPSGEPQSQPAGDMLAPQPVTGTTPLQSGLDALPLQPADGQHQLQSEPVAPQESIRPSDAPTVAGPVAEAPVDQVAVEPKQSPLTQANDTAAPTPEDAGTESSGSGGAVAKASQASPIVQPPASIGKSLTGTDPATLVGKPENGLQKAIRERREAKALESDSKTTPSQPPEKPSVTQAAKPEQVPSQRPESAAKNGAAPVDASGIAGKPADAPAVEAVAQGAKPPGGAAPVIDTAAHAAATSPRNDLPEPTDAQKKAGNYPKGHVKLAGMDLSIENPAESARSGKDRDGKAWTNTLKHHYGYIKGTIGNDKDHVDAFVKPDTPLDYAGTVYVVDQVHPDTGRFDEHKVLIGFDNPVQARAAYQANYAKGWKGLKAISALPMAEFKTWVYDGPKNRPLAQEKAAPAPAMPPSATQDKPPNGLQKRIAENKAEKELQGTYIGRENTPMGEGGKPFKTNKAARDAKKNQPMLRVVRVAGGFALAPKTEAQIDAQEKNARRLSVPRFGNPGVPLAAHEFIVGKGGLAKSTRSDMGIEGNPRVGNRFLFAGQGGLDMDSATELLKEAGYLPDGASMDDARNVINRSLRTPQYTSDGIEAMAEREMEDRRKAFEAEQEAIAILQDLEDNEWDATVDAFDKATLDMPQGLSQSDMDMEDALLVAGYTRQEIEDEQRESAAVPESDQGFAETPTGNGPQGDRGREGAPGQDSQAGSQEGLTAPTRTEVLAQQAQREAEEQRKKDGGDKPAPSKPLTGDVPDMFNTQGSVFDAPPDPNVGPAKALELPRLSNPDALRAKADLQNALADLGDIFNRPFKANITPEQEQKLIPVLVRVFDAAFRMGYHKFKDVAKFALDQIRTALGNEAADALTIDHLQGAYISMSGGKAGVDTKRTVIDVENKADIESHAAKAQNQPEDSQNVPSTDSSVERGGAKPAAESAVGAPVPAGSPGPDKGTGQDGVGAVGTGSGRASDSSVPVDGALVGGERGDKLLRGGNGAGRAASGDARTDFGERSGDSGITGIPFELIPTSQVDAVAGKGIDEIRNRQAQRAADSIDVKPGNLQNIRDTLPYLHEGQQDDVHKAEQVFAKPTGYGMLFTNGTGTGKTFSGLGIVKRAERQGKKNSLIVVPDDKIADDWIESGKALGLNITKLASTKDAGKGVVITTYANLGENDALAKRKWDLVVPDEAHSLMQSADGGVTGYLRNLRAITHHPDGAFDRFTMLNRSDIERLSFIGKEISANSRIMGNSDTMDAVRASLLKENEKLESEAQPLRAKLQAAREAVMLEVRDAQGAGRTRLAFLSATPFAYEKTVDWANGYLFDYKDGYPYTETSLAYNQPNAREHFFMTRFGYSMRFNKLTEPNGAKVDRGLLQRQFNGELKKKGVLSGRMLDVKPDYDRRFVLVDSAIGNKIDEAVEWLNEKARTGPAESEERRGYSSLRDRINESFDYLSRRYLLEAIKAQEVIPIIKKHMAMGRKVVVFHDYKKGGSVNPFDVSTGSAGASVDPDMLAKVRSFNAANTEFRAAFPELIAGLNGLRAPIEVFRGAFPDVLLVNGDEKKADLLKRYKQFQNDDTGPLVMLVQSAKNKGWSGHDTTGKNQRVLINLGQPTAPTLAIQQEGRIYRTGQASNAIMRYLNTGTNWERWAFATTIATRASTAENLGMGELSRALKDSFIASFEESDTYPPGHEGEGTGGKERDKAANNSITEYDRAKTFYWATQKKNSKTKAQEGADYFATPEPVGYKMVEWLDARPGEDLLEPSAGHGAISRWMPDTAKRTVVEPSTALRSRLAMVMSPEQDRIIAGTFEDLAVVNKYDGIAMNPPFGTAGRTAIDHLAKAATHLRDGGRVVALIPTGPSADKKFEKWFYEASEKPIKQLGSAMIDGQEVPIYKGDTVESRATWAPTGIVTGWREGAPMVKAVDKEFGGATSMVSAASILRVRSTGARTETYSPTADLHLIASIRLPQVTFERAGTAVATRIVVIEKQTDKASAPNTGGTQDRDLTDIDDINELFDRLENIALPGRQKADAPAAEAAPAQQERAPEPVKQAAPAAPVGADVILDGNPYKVEIYTTNAGKELRGVWVPRREIALKYGASTFKKQGFGFFVRERDFPKDGNTQFSRNTTGRGVPMADANAIVDAVRAALPTAPPIHILESIDKAPDDLKADIIKHGAQDDVDAAFHNGEIYVFPNNINSIERMAFVLAHHEIRHYGFRAMLGPKAGPIFLAIHATNPSIRAAAAEQVAKGYAKSRVLAVEEALADMPVEELVKLNGFDRIIAALREFLRSVASSLRRKGMAGLADAIDPKVWTDKDVAALIARAEGVSRGGSAKYRTPGTVFAEGAKPDQTQTAAFKKWFGKSAVVDKDGKPLVVYHGTARGNFASFADNADHFFTDDLTVARSYLNSKDYSGPSDFLPHGVRDKADLTRLGYSFYRHSGKWRVSSGESSTRDALAGRDFESEDQAVKEAIDIAASTGGDRQFSGVYQVHLSIQRPLAINAKGKFWNNVDDLDSSIRDIFENLDRNKYDGLIVKNVRDYGNSNNPNDLKHTVYVVDKPTQIKSATDNRGTFDAANPDIRFARSTITGQTANPPNIFASAKSLSDITERIKSATTKIGTVSLWDKTVGTQYHKSTKDADFKRVFDGFYQQTDDTAHYAIEAERHAPGVLMRLESLGDVWKGLMQSGSKQKADLAAVSKALFANIEGVEGVKQVEYDDRNLRDLFSLNPRQIEMYRQVRTAVNTSIDRLAQTYAAQFGQQQGMDIGGLKNMSLEDTVDAVKRKIREDHDEAVAKAKLRASVAAEDKGQVSKEQAKAAKDALAAQLLAMAKATDALTKRLDLMQEHATFLRENAYMPALRFGEYAVTVTQEDADGENETLHFEMFESQMAANLAAMRLRKEYPQADISKSILNKQQYEMFKGVSPETVALFAKFTGADQNEAVQNYIALAKSSRSVLMRQLKRKGVAGFSQDATRVLASFVTSNARQAAINMNQGAISDALASKALARKGDVQREAQKLAQYMNNPLEEARRLRGFMFMHFMGGSVASALVNMTQPVMMTSPYLSQFVGAKTAGIMLSSARMAASGKIANAQLRDAAARAAEDGITEPHEIHQLMADAGSSGLGNNLRSRAAIKAWGSFFSLAEAFNRRVTFIAAYQVAQSKNMPNPYEFARIAVIETQGLYGKVNRPNWARGAVGATLFTFKQFSIAWIEFLNRLPRKQKLLALGILVLAAGLQGLPFAEDVEDLIDTIGQSLGYNTNSKKALRKFLIDNLGQDLGSILDSGIFTQTAVDVQGRLGMGNLIPGTSIFKPSETNKEQTMSELVGPLGGILAAAQKALGAAQRGDLVDAGKEMLPVAAKNFAKGLDMLTTGIYKDTRGYKVADVTAAESFMKMLGLQPGTIAEKTRKMSDQWQDKSMVTMMESQIADTWAKGIFDKDPDQVARARKTLAEWNERNPDSRIQIGFPQIRRRVQQMNQTREQRFVKTVPKELRAGVARELAQ